MVENRFRVGTSGTGKVGDVGDEYPAYDRRANETAARGGEAAEEFIGRSAYDRRASTAPA